MKPVNLTKPHNNFRFIVVFALLIMYAVGVLSAGVWVNLKQRTQLAAYAFTQGKPQEHIVIKEILVTPSPVPKINQ